MGTKIQLGVGGLATRYVLSVNVEGSIPSPPAIILSAPVVQWIEYDATNVGTEVRFLPGVPSLLLLDNKMQ